MNSGESRGFLILLPTLEDWVSEDSISMSGYDPVFFHYKLTNTQSASKIIKFNERVTSSPDESYNVSSGKFVVPEDGVYHFFLQYYAGTKRSHSGIYVDNQLKSRIFNESTQVSIYGSLLIQLKKNQEVFVKLENGQMFGSSSDPLTSFQGLMVA